MSENLLKFLLTLSILGLFIGITTQGASLAAPQASIIVTTLEDENNGDGDCSLREAIRAANLNIPQDKCVAGSLNDPDTITFDVSGTIFLDVLEPGFSLTSSGPLTIDGGGAITVDGGDDVQIFSVSNNANLTLEGLTLENGYSEDDGGCITNEGNLELNNSTLSSCSAARNGGAIYNDSSLYIHDSTLSINTAGGYGGSIYIDSNASETIIDSSTLEKNSGSFGGAIYCRNTTINDSTISGNKSSSSGGGIFNYGILTINGSTIRDNSADSGGGVENTHTLTLNNSTVSNNSVIEFGGGIDNDGTLTIVGSTLSGNSAKSGGGIRNLDERTADISNSTLYDNNAAFYGGGIFNLGALPLLNSTLSGNHAEMLGGAIHNQSGLLTVDNCTFFGNSADLPGGGGAINNIGIAPVKGSILAGSTSGGNCGGDLVIDDGFNLEDAATCGFEVANDSMFNTPPLLAPLQDNGGTSWTHALLPGSPAIDVAGYTDCPATDQRGVPRPLDGDWSGGATCDIGAYEVGMFVVPLSQEGTLSPGETGNYQFTLYNYTDETDTYALTSDAGNWASGVSPDTVGPLPPGGTATFTLSVTVPRTAKVGSLKTAVAHVTSNLNPEVYVATAQVEIEVGPWHFYLPILARTE